MIKWNFPSRNNGDIEGFSNPALEWFKGNPLRAMAREICQNSGQSFTPFQKRKYIESVIAELMVRLLFWE